MPMIKKLINSGGSKAIYLPKDWLDYCEAEAGRRIDSVAIEVDGVLTIGLISHRSVREETDSGA